MTIPIIVDSKGRKYSHFVPFRKGGMGEIYKGYEENTKQEVVVKLIVISDPTEEELLLRELDACRHFAHKNLVETYSTGKIVIDGGNYLYIIQKFYPNGNLRVIIKENIPIDQCFAMMSDILLGMQEMHKVIIHRDMKPENILIDSDGHLVITDFGIAKYVADRTRTNSFKGSGTIPYMSPECWQGDTNTISMDIYAVGIISFEIFTGKHPYNARNESEWKDCHIYKPLPDISTYREGLNTKIKQIIQKMAAKKVSDRYQDAGEIIDAITEAKGMQSSGLKDIERLAAMGNFAIQQANEAKLKADEEEEKKTERIKLLNYHITDLFNKVIEKVNAINNQFETEKIIITESSIDTTNTKKKLKLTFKKKDVVFIFGDYDSVERFEKKSYDDSIKFQKERYRMILQSPGKTYLGENNFVLVGIAETSFKFGTSEYGFNLLLKKAPGDLYGEWYKMVISKNIQPPETSFGLDLSIFYTKYEDFRGHPLFTVKVDKLTDKDIVDLLEKIMW